MCGRNSGFNSGLIQASMASHAGPTDAANISIERSLSTRMLRRLAIRGRAQRNVEMIAIARNLFLVTIPLFFAAQLATAAYAGQATSVYGNVVRVGVGDFDGDGTSDLVWRSKSDVPMVLYPKKDGPREPYQLRVERLKKLDAAWRLTGVGDFDDNGQSDILWRHDTGGYQIWLMDWKLDKDGEPVELIVKTPEIDPMLAHTDPDDWYVVGIGDFDEDGKSDIFSRRRKHQAGAGAIAYMDGVKVVRAPEFTPIENAGLEERHGWHVRGIGDFDGDEKSDILVRRSETTGEFGIWFVEDSKLKGPLMPASASSLGTEWKLDGVGDFDGDKKADLLWRRLKPSGSATSIWFMDGIEPKEMPAILHNYDEPEFSLVGDYDGDGRADIMWHTEGAVMHSWAIQEEVQGDFGPPYLPVWYVDGKRDAVRFRTDGYPAAGFLPTEPFQYLGQIFNSDLVVTSDTQVRPGYVNPVGYGYAPTIVKWNESYHMFIGAADYSGRGSDQIRYSVSQDGRTWSDPRIVLYTSDEVGERCCCDPSLVYFKDQWYLFYSGNAKDVQTAMFVARSDRIGGPYLKYTKRGTWEHNPRDPSIILGPVNSILDEKAADKWYGAGQQTVVVKDGKLLAWFNDTTLFYEDDNQEDRIRFVTSDDGVTWSEPITAKNSEDESELSAASVDVKYDGNESSFVMFEVNYQHHYYSSPRMCRSEDGVNWSSPIDLCDSLHFPSFSHNIGVSGDEHGHLLPEGVIVAYGGFHSGANDVLEAFHTPQDSGWGRWDMLGHFLGGPSDHLGWGSTITGFPGPKEPTVPTLDVQGLTPGKIAIDVSLAVDDSPHAEPYFIGDFDGDGGDDIGRLHTGARWFVINGQDGSPFNAPWWGGLIPGWPRHGRYLMGDFNGDGADDIAYLAPWARWYMVSGRNGEPFGSPWWGNEIPGWPADGRYFVGDFDGDNADDIAYVHPEGRCYIVRGRDGKPFAPYWWDSPIEDWPGNGHNFVGDFDGDGDDDIAYLSPGIPQGRWSLVSGRNGNRFDSPWWGNEIPGWPGNGRYLVGDFDGDGADDIAYLHQQEARWYIVRGRDGKPFGPPWWGNEIPGWPADGRYFVGDFDADGADDIAYLSQDKPWGRWYIVNGRDGSPRGLSVPRLTGMRLKEALETLDDHDFSGRKPKEAPGWDLQDVVTGQSTYADQSKAVSLDTSFDVPDVEGKTLKEALEVLSDKGLTPKLPPGRSNDLRDLVLEQSPAAKTAGGQANRIFPREMVQLFEFAVLVPDVEGSPVSDALETLSDRDLQPRLVPRDVKRGDIVHAQEVTGDLIQGRYAKAGTVVSLYLAREVPPVRGQTWSEGKQRLEAAGFSTEPPDGATAGSHIFETDPTGGQVAPVSEPVTVIPGVKVPDVVGSTGDPERELKRAGFQSAIYEEQFQTRDPSKVGKVEVIRQRPDPGLYKKASVSQVEVWTREYVRMQMPLQSTALTTYMLVPNTGWNEAGYYWICQLSADRKKVAITSFGLRDQRKNEIRMELPLWFQTREFLAYRMRGFDDHRDAFEIPVSGRGQGAITVRTGRSGEPRRETVRFQLEKPELNFK